MFSGCILYTIIAYYIAINFFITINLIIEFLTINYWQLIVFHPFMEIDFKETKLLYYLNGVQINLIFVIIAYYCDYRY